MKVLIISTSPRKSFSTSMYFSKLLKGFLMGNEVKLCSLQSVSEYNKIITKLKEIDVLVFATPVYVDAIPSTTLEYLKKLEGEITSKGYKFDVYAILNCGFYEGHQCANALKLYEMWCNRASLCFRGGVGIGSGVMLGFLRVLPLIGLAMAAIGLIYRGVELQLNHIFSFTTLFSGYIPFNALIQMLVWFLLSLGVFVNLFKLRNSICNQKYHNIHYTTVWFCPRILFVAMASIYWVIRAVVLHGNMPWNLFYKEIQDNYTSRLKGEAECIGKDM